MTLPGRDWLSMESDRLAVVCDPGGLAGFARARYPALKVTESPSYLAGIASLADAQVCGVLVGVDSSSRKLCSAIAALRKAAGSGPRLVICCRPSAEPAAREVLAAGADDYVIYPPRGDELDQALRLSVVGSEIQAVGLSGKMVLPNPEELKGLTDAMAGLSDGRKALLDRLCAWLADAMRTAHVEIIAGTCRCRVGDPASQPALVETVVAGGRPLGEILIGNRQKAPFSVEEVEKFRHYAQIVAQLIDAADRQETWRSLAMTDELTGLPNRRYLMQVLGKLIAQAGQQRFRVTVFLYDLDGFKHFNDTYGHGAGDDILREISRLFRVHCRQHDIVARCGGDEFAVVFWDAEEPRVVGSKHPTDILTVLKRAKVALHSHEFPKLGPEATGSITISGGLATFPWDAQDVQGLLDRADEALRRAKEAGKNRIYIVGGNEDIDKDV